MPLADRLEDQMYSFFALMCNKAGDVSPLGAKGMMIMNREVGILANKLLPYLLEGGSVRQASCIAKERLAFVTYRLLQGNYKENSASLPGGLGVMVGAFSAFVTNSAVFGFVLGTAIFACEVYSVLGQTFYELPELHVCEAGIFSGWKSQFKFKFNIKELEENSVYYNSDHCYTPSY